MKSDLITQEMELSDVGEHVFAAECIMMSRMNKVPKLELENVNKRSYWRYEGKHNQRTERL